MMHNDVIFNDDSAMSHDKGNAIISDKGLDEQKLP